MRSLAAILASSLVAAATAHAAPTVSLVTLLAVHDAYGWHVDAEVEGTGLTAAALTPPGGDALAVPCESGEGVILCEREEPAPPNAGFASLAAMLGTYPAGTWHLSIDGGVRTADLPFDPEEPNGAVTVTSPANGATGVPSMPTVAYQNECTTCAFLAFRIEDADTLGMVTEIEDLVTGEPPLPSGQIAFADFFDDAPIPLADGAYQIVTGAGLGTLETRSFKQGGHFQYGSGGERQSTSQFRVPEPAAATGSAAVVAALAALSLRHRRG